MENVDFDILSYFTKLYKGKLVIWANENFLFNEVLVINQDAKIVNIAMVTSDGDIIPLSCTFEELEKAVVC